MKEDSRMSESYISSVSQRSKAKDVNDFFITKKQVWDGSVMCMIWKDRHLYDSTQMKMLKNLMDNARKNYYNNISVVIYGYPDNAIGKLKFGRLVAKNKCSLERVKKIFRHSLCAVFCFDIDMVNAQPVLLVQLAKKHGVPMKYLTRYIENREEVLKEMMEYYNISRDEAKEWIIKCIFGAKIPKLKVLREELENLAMVLSEKYPILYSIVKELKEENHIGTFLAYIAQTEECKCLLAMNEYLEGQGRIVCVLCYDGCMILKKENETEFPKDLLRNCEKYIFEKTGYKIDLLEKPMEIAPQFMNGPTKFYKEEIDDKYMTEKFIKLMGNKIKNDEKKGIIIYDEKTGLWKDNENDYIRHVISNSNLVEHVLDGVVNYSGYLQRQDIIFKELPCFISPEKFVDHAINRSIGKLLFSNGIYDMTTKTFTTSFDPTIVFKGALEYEFPERNPEIEAKVNKLFFEDPFLENEREVGDYLKKLIIRGIGGFYIDKSMVIAVGTSDSGKSKLFNILQDIFCNITGTYNMNVFRYQKNNSQDEAKKNAWLLEICDDRVSFASEVSKLGIYCANTLKTAVSGGDPIIGRSNYEDEIRIVNKSTLFFACNDIPVFYPIDQAICNRLKIIEYKLTFVANPKTKYERKLIDVDELFKNKEYQTALINVLLDAFEPNKPIPGNISLASAKEWVPTPSSSIKDTLESKGYIIDKNDKESFVPFDELKQLLLLSVCKGMSDTAIGKELSKIDLIGDNKKINGIKTTIRRCIKKLNKNIEMNENNLDPQV